MLRTTFISLIKRSKHSHNNVAKVIYSGIQPTGGLPHLGNYLGALKPWAENQNNNDFSEIYYSIVDLHAMTASSKSSIDKNSLEMTCALLACGIDPEKSCLYRQSHVPQHTMLYWLFSCYTSLPRLYHLTQWRQKAQQNSVVSDANVPVVDLGLYSYPILQAADILLFKGTHVPVGEDQLQHLRLCQEIARKFNNTIFPSGSIKFPIPQPLINQDDICAKVHSLRNPTAKMSKSDTDKRSRINLDDDPDTIREKFKKSITDPKSHVSYDETQRPGVSNLISIHAAVTGKSIDCIVSEASNINTGAYKMIVADCVIETLRPIRTKIKEYMSDMNYVKSVLDKGSKKARLVAEKNWKDIASSVGLW